MADRSQCGDRPASFSGVRLLTADDWAAARDGRLAALRDAPEAFLAAEPHESTWEEGRWRHSFTTGEWAAAESAGQVVGIARLSREETGRHLESVWTHPDHRCRGIASQLAARLVAAERARGPGEIFVWVFPPNPVAFRLYESLGFEWTGERQRIGGNGRVEVRLCLNGAIREG